MSDMSQMLDSLPPLREVIEQHDLAPKKSLGQNFLLDSNVTDKIVRCTQDRYEGDWSDVHALEIGPGPGGLTRSLLKSGLKHVTAVEFDERAVAAQQDLMHVVDGRLTVLHQDAMTSDLLDFSSEPRVIVANLPYNIATPLLIGWLKQIKDCQSSYACMTLMFQKEVAERVCAAPNTKSYGRLGVIAQWLCDVQIVYNLPPSAFTPPPKVDSAVVHFKPKILEEGMPVFKDIERVTAAAFGQRRKMIRSSLKEYCHALDALGIEGTRRAETLSVQEFLDIASFKP